MSESDGRWATSVVLASGATAFLRPMTAADKPLLKAFHERQPAEATYLRFFSAKPTLSDAELEHFTNVDMHDRVALVMEIDGEFVAWASYERWAGRADAEVAFMVDAAHQGEGIATLMLEHLAAIARSNGITRFNAEVLADNRPMLGVFAKAGWPVQRRFDSGVVDIEFPLDDTDRFRETVAQREQRADSRAMARLLLPRSVAVVGASARPASVGGELWRSARRGARVPVYPVNPAHDVLDGARCYASVLDIPDEVDLAVIAVPPTALGRVVDECLTKNVRGAVVVTAVDDAEPDVAAMIERARRHGMRIVGPASMGIAQGRAPGAGGVQAMLAPFEMPAGKVAVSLQSGTLGASLLQLASRLSLGLSWFVSLGDKRDVSGNDLLQFWEDDENTAVICIYTERFGNPRKFARIARRVSRRRPIVTVRTGAAAANPAADALYAQAGLIQVTTVRELLDTARVLATQPVPRGPRVTVLTNSRSPGVLAEAALAAAGLTVVAPPVPLSFRSTEADYGAALEAAVASAEVDSVLVIHAPPVLSAPTPAATVDRVASTADKPVVAVCLGHANGPLLPGSAVPSFAFPEPAAAVLGQLWRYRAWLDSEAAATPEPFGDVDPERVDTVVRPVLDRGETVLGWAEAQSVLRAYGITVAEAVQVVDPTADAVVSVAEQVGYPVAVKSATRGVGRSAEAGIALDLADEHAVREAVAVVQAHQGHGTLLVQRMVRPGVEVRLRAETDPQLGPAVYVGLGGVNADAIGDQVGRLPPMSVDAARAAVASTKAGAALAVAGLPVDALAETMARLGQLVSDHPEIRRVDANPVIVAAGGCAVTDVLVEVTTAVSGPEALRRLV